MPRGLLILAVRPHRCVNKLPLRQETDLLFGFVLEGEVSLQVESHGDQRLAAGDALTLPAGLAYRLIEPSEALELLTVTLFAAR